MTTNSGEQAYYDDLWRKKGGRLEQDSKFKEKVSIIGQMIPADVKTILDVGCGDGSITNSLALRYRTTGVDTSAVGLGYLGPDATAVLSSAADLPFPDASFDLVLSSELLEHLASPTFERALAEIIRVSRRYVLISVPNNENLRRRTTRCPGCGHMYHLYCHYRSFNQKSLPGYFPGFQIRQTCKCGYLEKPSLDLFWAVRQKLFGLYSYVSSIELLCPNCGARSIPPRRCLIQRLISRGLTVGERLLTLLLGMRAEPDWLIVLFERCSA